MLNTLQYYMWVYKITNTINGKSYIGQTIRPINERWRRHVNDAINNKLDTHFARAIRKYGEKVFSIEKIDSAETQDELNILESFYIHKYNSIKNGYNETDSVGKCGGNTYLSKTEEEMDIIKEKIRLSKLGGLNPNSKSIVLIDTITGIELTFSSLKECSKYLGLPTHHPISRILKRKTKKLLDGRYDFRYCKDESVSTIGDECSRVGEEIGTSPKQETSDISQKKI